MGVPPVSLRVRASIIVMLVLAAFGQPSSVLACSPPFEQPTIRALGPDQVVVVGSIGEKVAGGRLFHIERWFNGRIAGTPILIAFKEGEPVGDCSYPVHEGQHLLIAPVADPAGGLSADLGTLQADPDTQDGRRYLAEAKALFGPGVVPPSVAAATPLPATIHGQQAGVVTAAIGAVVIGSFVLVFMAARRRPTGP